MMGSSRLVVGATLLLLLAMVAGTGAASPGVLTQTADEDLDPDDIVLHIELEGDDRATWTIEHRYRLADDEDEQAFQELEEDIEADRDAYRDRFADRMERTAATAAEATDREMEISNVSVTTETRSLPQEYGIVRYQFTWHGFAVQEGDELHAGDAIAGLFLDEDSRLRMSWPAEYEASSVAPEPTDSGDTWVAWNGPMEFGSDEPRVTVSQDSGLLSLVTLLGIVGVLLIMLLLLVLGRAWWLRYRRDEPEPATPPAATDTALLSNEERVIQLLESRGGRMKQQEVVEHLGWTDAKTSQVLSELREEGEVESFRLGRENVLKLADTESTE